MTCRLMDRHQHATLWISGCCSIIEALWHKKCHTLQESSFTLFVYAFLRAERWLCEITVSTRAIDFLTTLLQGEQSMSKPALCTWRAGIRHANDAQYIHTNADAALHPQRSGMAAAVPSATDSSESLMRSSHLRELIGGASSDLGYPASSQLLLQFLQLCPKLTLALLAQLMRLELGCTNIVTSVRTSCESM